MDFEQYVPFYISQAPTSLKDLYCLGNTLKCICIAYSCTFFERYTQNYFKLLCKQSLAILYMDSLKEGAESVHMKNNEEAGGTLGGKETSSQSAMP